MTFRFAWLIGVILCVQEAAAVPQWAFRISFTDKTGSPAVTNPSAFLSPRAIARRTTQGVTVTDADRPVSAVYTDSVLHVTTGKMHSTSRWFNNCVILLDDSSRIALLQGRPFISKIECVGYFGAGLHLEAPTGPDNTTPSTPANKGTGTPAHYGSAWAQTSIVNGDFLHDNGLSGQGQLIAVLDLGFLGANTHAGFDSLRARNGIVDQFNFVNANTNVYSRSDHGTSSLSTMAGLIPGSYVGAAPGASYALYIVDDVDYTDALYELDNVIGAMERADSIGADIITASVGYNEFVNPSYFIYPKSDFDGHTTSVAKAANMAVDRGIFVSVSAGNEAGNAWNFLLTPGDADSALTIGSVNAARVISGFSSPGPNSSGRIKPDICMQGDPVAVLSGGASGIGTRSGTSFATPQLSGWAACLREMKPNIRPFQLRDVITRSADRYAAPLSNYGYGIPDFKKVFQFLGVDNIPAGGLMVSPNPFNKNISLQLTLNKAVDVQCRVMDINGKCVAEKSFNKQQGTQKLAIEVPTSLPSGIYFLQTTIGTETYTNKLTKQ